MMKAVVAGAALLSATAVAQGYPVKPVKIIAPTGPGLSTDIAARLLADGLSRAMSQQFFVENMPGAATIVGAQAAARAAPDGYTLLMATAGTLVNNPFIYKTLPYDPQKDFAPIAIVGDTSAFVISANPNLPAKTLADVIALEKSQPGRLSYAIEVSSGVAAMIGRYLNKQAGVSLVEVPYKAAAQAMQDTIAGRTQLMISSVGTVEPMVKAGKLRYLASTAETRPSNLAQVPTVHETYPGFVLAGFFALVAPAATPAPVLQRLNREVVAVARQPEFGQRIQAMGLQTNKLATLQETARTIRLELERWGAVNKAIGTVPQ